MPQILLTLSVYAIGSQASLCLSSFFISAQFSQISTLPIISDTYMYEEVSLVL